MNGFTYENTDRKETYETYEWDNLWIEHADKPELTRVLYIGDSISCGTRGYATSQANGEIYFDNFSTSKAVDNSYFKDALKAFARQLPRRDAVIFNNGLHGWHLDDDTEYRQHYEDMVKFLTEEFSGTPIAIVLTTYITDERRIDRVKARNKVATDIAAKYNLPVIDLYSLTKAAPELLMEDRVHFTPDGYKMIANEIIKSVKTFI